MEQEAEYLDKLKQILLKKAEGYYYDEESIEYQNEAQEKTRASPEQLSMLPPKSQAMVVSKRKVTTKYVPPDLSAIKMLLELFPSKDKSDLTSLSEEELKNLKDELIKKLKEL